MKRIIFLLTFSCFGLALSTTLSAGVVPAPPPDVLCNESVSVCLEGDLIDVDVRCVGPEDLFSGGVYIPGSDTPFHGVFWYDENYVCELSGYLDSPKTEFKCTTAANGPAKPGKKGYDADDVTVEVEMKRVEEDSWACLN